MTPAVLINEVRRCIFSVRDSQVILDEDMARFYEVSPKRLNEQVRRNIERFPPDFMFQLQHTEYDSIKTQMIVFDSSRGKHRKYLPLVFTEQGAAMLSGVLKSERAIEVNIAIMRAFVQLRYSPGQFADLKEELRVMRSDLGQLQESSKFLLSSLSEFRNKKNSESKDNLVESYSSPNSALSSSENIIKVVAKHFGFKVQELKGASRKGRVPLARQIAMYLIRKRVGSGCREIGNCFGKDHSTVLHACRKIEEALAGNDNIISTVETIERLC